MINIGAAKNKKHLAILLYFGLCLFLIAGLIPAGTAKADLSGVSVTLRDSAVVGESSGYDIQMTVGAAGSLAPANTITVLFPSDTTVPTSIAPGYVFVKSVAAQTVSVSGRQVTVTLAAGCNVINNETFTLMFALGAGLKNPTTPSAIYTVSAWTNRETTPVTSSSYTIGGVEVQRTGGTIGTYVTIQAAIDNAGTQDGDTLLIHSATYPENVNVNKELTLQGTGATVPIIDGGAGGTTVTIADSNVTLTGLTIQNGPTGIAVTSGTNNKVNNCNIITNTTYGLNNTSGNPVDAEDNWWGDIAGPLHAGNTYNKASQTEQVTDNVDYVPWLDLVWPYSTPFAPVVNPTHSDYSSIQAAIDATTTVDGDTINCAAGTYTENVNVNKLLTLQGAGSGTTTVNAANPDNSVFTVTADNVSISGFTVSGATGGGQAGIFLGAGVANCNIHDNILTNSFDGIWLGSGSNHNTLTNNTVNSNTRQGFEVYISDYNTFSNNIANSNTSYGFKIDSGDHNTFTNNTANSNGKYGFYVVMGDGGGATNSAFTNNTANSNTEYGIRINGGRDYALTGNTFDSNVTAGFRLKEAITNFTADNNTIANSPTGIDIDVSVPSDNITTWTVTHNNIVGNSTYGISNNTAAGILNATNNWWGSTNGPIHAGNTFNVATQGDEVSNSVDYVPWWNAAYPGGTSFAPVVNPTHSDYSSIQAAIDATTTVNGDTINCAAGTYTEALTIDKRLTFTGKTSAGANAWTVGTPGAAASCPEIVYDGATSNMIEIWSDNVTIQGFKINSTGGATVGIVMAGSDNHSGQTIQYCSFAADEPDISIGVAGFIASRFLIDYCSFQGTGATSWFLVQPTGGTAPGSVNTISHNSCNGTVSQLLLGTKGIKSITYSNNSFSNVADGILLDEPGDQSTGKFDNILVEQNTFASGGTADYFFRVSNDVDDSDFQGGAYNGTQVIVRYNNFGTNTGGSFEAVSFDVPSPSDNLTAKFNFWGHASGPSHTDATLGNITYGADVSSNVNFQPWLVAAYSTTPTGGDISVTTTSPLPDGQTGLPYSENFTSTGGTGTKTWAYYGPGSLGEYPPGLTVGAGVISGTPTKSKDNPGFNFGIQVSDGVQGTYQAFELPVYIGQLPIITTTSLPNGRVGTAYSENLTATGGTGTYTWSVYSGSLPPPLTLGAGTGLISGTPSTAGTYNFRAKVVSGGVAYKDLSIQIVPVGEKITCYLNGTWYLDYNGNGAWNGAVTDRQYSFGSSVMKPVTGDWDGNGTTEIGCFYNGTWYLDYNGNGAWNGAVTDRQYSFGSSVMKPVTGDWNNDGTTEIGCFYNGTWYLDYNGNGAWNGAVTDRQYSFGSATMTPVSGDWDGL